MGERALNVYRVLREEYERLHGPLPADNVDWDSLSAEEEERKVRELLPGLYGHIHEKGPSALSISGGGIRSATFALGVIQRLAWLGLLPKFDYLSTVSGGGYIGSWLSSYVRRTPDAVEGVTAQLSSPASTPLDVEPEPIRHLREFSNYLTPRLGLMSADTWSLVGNYLRNLLLNWLILIPLLAALLAVPRVVVAVLRHEPKLVEELGLATLVLLLIAFLYLALSRPVRNRRKSNLLSTNNGFLLFVLLPFFLASIGGALYAGWKFEQDRNWWLVFWLMVGSAAAASVFYMIRYARANRNENRGDVAYGTTVTKYTLKKGLQETISAAVSSAVATGLLYLADTFLFNDPRTPVALARIENWRDFPAVLSSANAEIFVCFAVPLLLVIFFIQAALFVGLSSWFNEDYDREWWARAGGWVLVAGLVWIVFTGISIYGPVLIYMAPRLFAAFGTVTGVFTILFGKSGKTAGSSGQKEEGSNTTTAGNMSLALAGPIFVVCILALISLLTSRILLSQSKAPRITDREIARYSGGTYQIKETEQLDDRRQRVLETGKFPAIEKDKVRAIEHLYVVDNAHVKSVVPILLATILSWLVSLFVGVNKFSMHAFYRNRLIRAYLGASRWSRQPDPFTGFDPYDNINLHELRRESFWVYSIRNLDTFVAALRQPPGGAAGAMLKNLYDLLTPRTRDLLEDYRPGEKENQLVCELMFEDLNRIIDEYDLKVSPPAEKPYDPARSLANRTHLDQVLAEYLHPASGGRPFHIVNMALNLVSGENLAWQQRKASSFTASPLHCGNYLLGYRASREYGGPGGISLGTAVAISGAAASPNMGYHSSPALSFLLTLFNVRLGWWLGNPGPAGDNTYRLRNPRSSLRTLIAEFFGNTNDRHPYIYLSDGGHFENLALYEMVLRRCRNIVVLDGGSDENYVFEDLGNAIRKINIDLGIKIVMRHMEMYPRSRSGKNQKYCAIGDIHYSVVDGEGAPDGRLLYIKPAFYGEKEPRDVYNYAQTSSAFPHESTGDQWFSESQFESYRALGYFALSEVVKPGARPADIAALIQAADDYLGSNELAMPGEII